ncbi:MAG: TIGR00730 family Rossman fold protein [Bacteroidetes bacterium]|nr:TIGR00730 family Rossman fold protein [Bacteroidota bacterium]
MKRVVIFCGSSIGTENIFHREATQLGTMLAMEGITIVYGGAKVGLMGAVASGALQHGGTVIGVLPRFLQSKEIAHPGLSELILVESMHERKNKMNELCDSVIALPGGYGTMDEFFEMLTWAQLGLHQKPVALLNTARFYDPLITMVHSMMEKGFLKPVNRDMLIYSDNIDELLHKMRNYIPPVVEKWITKEKT